MRLMATLRLMAYAAAAALMLMALAIEADAASPGDGASLTTPGPFALRTTDGGTLESLDLDGSPYGLMFGFTHCPDVCPTALAEITAALGAAKGLGPDYHVYFVAVDEERDTPDAVKAYLAAFDPRIVGLTGDAKELAEAARAFGATARRRDYPDGGYAMEHTAALFLVDENGVIADRVAFTESPDAIAKRIVASTAR